MDSANQKYITSCYIYVHQELRIRFNSLFPPLLVMHTLRRRFQVSQQLKELIHRDSMSASAGQYGAGTGSFRFSALPFRRGCLIIQQEITEVVLVSLLEPNWRHEPCEDRVALEQQLG